MISNIIHFKHLFKQAMFSEFVSPFILSIVIDINYQFTFKISNFLKFKCIASKSPLDSNEVALTTLQKQKAYSGSKDVERVTC